MAEISGNAGEARALALEIVENELEILDVLEKMAKALQRLGKDAADEQIREFETILSGVGKKFREILPVTKEAERKLNAYADAIDRAAIRECGMGVLYGENGCGTRPDFGVSGGVLRYPSADGSVNSLGLDDRSLTESYRAAGEAEKESLRAISELMNLRKMMDICPEQSQGIQLAGSYGELKHLKLGQSYDAHHMPPKSVLGVDKNELPAILLPRGFHRKTDSYGGRMGHGMRRMDPDEAEKKKEKYKDALAHQIGEGNFADAVRNEIYEIQLKFGHRMDGALDQFIDCMIRYYAEHGVPKIKGSA